MQQIVPDHVLASKQGIHLCNKVVPDHVPVCNKAVLYVLSCKQIVYLCNTVVFDYCCNVKGHLLMQQNKAVPVNIMSHKQVIYLSNIIIFLSMSGYVNGLFIQLFLTMFRNVNLLSLIMTWHTYHK